MYFEIYKCTYNIIDLAVTGCLPAKKKKRPRNLYTIYQCKQIRLLSKSYIYHTFYDCIENNITLYIGIYTSYIPLTCQLRVCILKPLQYYIRILHVYLIDGLSFRGMLYLFVQHLRPTL